MTILTALRTYARRFGYPIAEAEDGLWVQIGDEFVNLTALAEYLEKELAR